MANPNYAYLQGGMAGYAASASSNSAPGTPSLAAAASISRAASPAVPLTLSASAPGASSGHGAHPDEHTVPKSEFDALAAQFAEQSSQIEALKRELEEAANSAQQPTSDMADSSEVGEQLAQERELRSKAEAEAQSRAAEVDALRQELSSLHAQNLETALGDVSSDASKLAELEGQLSELRLKSERDEASWSTQRDELQKKLANAEKQVVKAAAAGRNTNKKKEQQQTAAMDSLKGELKTKDAEIARLTAQIEELTEKVKAADGVDELKSKLAGLEKEQEDLLVYLADQDQQAKEYRAMLRKHGEDIPLSDDDDDGDE
ncbi:hypothetical protein IWW50_003023 [Coemansia erecta]|nr:hypothetical protein IWW50_003023 [Coemansia erecta]